MSAARIASVSLVHNLSEDGNQLQIFFSKRKGRKINLLDSYSSCSDSGNTFFGAIREVEGSKRTFFSLVSLSLNSIADDQ